MDNLSQQTVQDDAFAREGFSMQLAIILRRYSRQFAWPMLLLYLAAPTSPHALLEESALFSLGLGVPILLAGIILRLWSQGFLRKEGFVYDGPYRYVRNPVELGTALTYVGAAFLMGLPWWYNFVALVLTITYLSIVSVAYEQEHYRAGGAVYLRYRQRVRRWFPGSLPGTNRSNRSYSLKHALINERYSILWIAMYILVFAYRRHYRH